MCYLNIRNQPRTNEQYRNCSDEDHHRGPSPLSRLPIHLVSDVPFEVLHLVYLGNVKKVINAHVTGRFPPCGKLNVRKLEILDSRMIHLKEYCPSEFNRQPREITKYSHFKGTEFRQFLLYTSPAVFCMFWMKNIISIL